MGYCYRKWSGWFQTWYSHLGILMLLLILYRILSYGILQFAFASSISIATFFRITFASILPNVVYGIFLYCILCSKKQFFRSRLIPFT